MASKKNEFLQIPTLWMELVGYEYPVIKFDGTFAYTSQGRPRVKMIDLVDLAIVDKIRGYRERSNMDCFIHVVELAHTVGQWGNRGEKETADRILQMCELGWIYPKKKIIGGERIPRLVYEVDTEKLEMLAIELKSDRENAEIMASSNGGNLRESIRRLTLEEHLEKQLEKYLEKHLAEQVAEHPEELLEKNQEKQIAEPLAKQVEKEVAEPVEETGEYQPDEHSSQHLQAYQEYGDEVGTLSHNTGTLEQEAVVCDFSYTGDTEDDAPTEESKMTFYDYHAKGNEPKSIEPLIDKILFTVDQIDYQCQRSERNISAALRDRHINDLEYVYRGVNRTEEDLLVMLDALEKMLPQKTHNHVDYDGLPF